MRLSHLFLALLILESTAYGFNNNASYPTLTSLPNTQLLVHLEPNINLSVTNFGILGPYGIVGPDTVWPGETIPGAMFPAGSDLDYLFFGAIWIGAEIDTIDQNGNPVLDTLVSVGNDGWWGDIFELYPEESPGGSMWREEVMADEEIYGVYYDTCESNFVVPDPNDQRPHIPLGLKITQHSFTWSSPGYNDFIIVDFVIENILSRYLHNVWVGIYWDGDVLHYQSSPFYGITDDICGYIENNGRGIGWLADNDGDPNYSNEPGQFDYRSPTGVLGLTLLGSSTPGLETNFNWWISNINSNFDWGPQLIENYHGPFPGGGKGTPGGDKAKYSVMSNREHDYDQMWCALPGWEYNGWIPRSPQAYNLADGYDAKYLISFGPFDLPAGEVETLTVAVLGGSSFHTDPANFSTYLENHTYDSSSIAIYYDNLGIDRLVDVADSVMGFYQLGYINIPPGPPSDFRLAGWGENFVALEWDPLYRANLLEYRLYRGTEPGVYEPRKLTPDGFLDTVFVDSSVQSNITYYYAILSANIFGNEGGYSPEVSINTGQPQNPTGLTAEGGDSRVDLTWNHNPEPDIFGYLVHKSEGPDNFTMLIDTIRTNSFTDTYVGNGLEFYYYITAIDSSLNVSFNSDTVSVIPMGFDYGILLINCTSDNPQINPDFDSMTVFYENVLSNYRHQAVNHTPLTLPEVADYSTLIYAKELSAGYQRFYIAREMLESYLGLGGNIILAGTRQLTPNSGVEGIYQFAPDEIQNQYFDLDGAEFPGAFDNMEFTGGNSESPDFSDFVLDSSRTSRILYPQGLPDGRLSGIGALIPNDTSEVIYTYVATNPDTSNYHGRPVGIVHRTDTYNTAVLEFPLYYVEEPISYQILHQILSDFGEIPLGIDEDQVSLPKSTRLLRNYPNPFNNFTTLKYDLTEAGEVSITIYNILGQKVAEPVNGYQQPGAKTVTWRADDLPSGIYFARMKTEDYSGSIKLMLLK